MAKFIGEINFESSRYTPIDFSFSLGRKLVLIGESDQGNYMNPIYPLSLKNALSLVGEGSLFQAYEVVKEAQAKNVYLIRINQDGEVLTDEEKQERLIEACEIAVFSGMNVLVPVNMFFDSEVDFATPLTSICGKNQDTFSVIGLRELDAYRTVPAPDPVETNEELKQRQISNLVGLSLANNGFYDNDQEDIGKYLSVVGSEINLKASSGWVRKVQGYLIYAAILSRISPGFIPINMSLGLDCNLAFEYTKDEQKTLADKGYIVFNDFIRNGVSPASGNTMSKSDLKMVSDIMLMQYILWYVKESGEYIVGRSQTSLKNFQDLIVELMTGLVSSGSISDYDLDFSYQDQDLLVRIGIETINGLVVQDILAQVPYNA